MKSILLIEDDKALSNGICLALKSDLLQISPCYDLKKAKMLFDEKNFDLIILDVNLPDGTGLDFLIEIRKFNDIPVILLTANDLEMDVIVGLESGANDYITKPFSLSILRARVNTQLRLHHISSIKKMEHFSFDFEHMDFYCNTTKIDLSKTEQKLLYYLVENSGIVLSRDTLLKKIWPDGKEYVDENALSVTIKRLRDKLEQYPSKPQYIKTVYGIGYIWTVTEK